MEQQTQQTAVEWFFEQLLLNPLPQSKDELLKGDWSDIFEQAKQMEKEQSNAKIQKAIEKFEEAKSKASSLKDIVYLDGVLAVLDTIKNETFKNK